MAATMTKTRSKITQPVKEDRRSTSGPAKRAETLRLKREAEALASKKRTRTKPESTANQMEKSNTREPKLVLPEWDVFTNAANMYKKIGDPTRLAIIYLLKNREMNVGTICSFLNHSQPAVSHHLALLLHSRVVAKRREGKHNIYRLANKAMFDQTEDFENLAKANL